MVHVLMWNVSFLAWLYSMYWHTFMCNLIASYKPCNISSFFTKSIFLFYLESTVLSLKEQCRVVILRSLKRHRYSSISLLPLPSYLQQFVSLGRQWNIPLNEPELMTPLPEEEEEEEGEGEGEGEEEGQGERERREISYYNYCRSGGLATQQKAMPIRRKYHTLKLPSRKIIFVNDQRTFNICMTQLQKVKRYE